MLHNRDFAARKSIESEREGRHEEAEFWSNQRLVLHDALANTSSKQEAETERTKVSRDRPFFPTLASHEVRYMNMIEELEHEDRLEEAEEIRRAFLPTPLLLDDV